MERHDSIHKDDYEIWHATLGIKSYVIFCYIERYENSFYSFSRQRKLKSESITFDIDEIYT